MQERFYKLNVRMLSFNILVRNIMIVKCVRATKMYVASNKIIRNFMADTRFDTSQDISHTILCRIS